MLQKYFIALVPPEPVLSEMETIKKTISETYQTKGALLSPPHITLHMPFKWEEEKEEKLISCLESFQFPETFPVVLSNFACFEPRVVFINVVESDKLVLLQKKLVQHIKQNLLIFNQSDDLRGFHPHITVAFRDLKKQTFYKIWEHYKNETYNTSFSCNAISLLKHNGKTWDVYRKIDCNTADMTGNS